MRRLFITCLLFLIASTATFAQIDPGVFAIIGFSDPELVYVNQATGTTHSLGTLAPTAYSLRIHQDRLYVINGDDWFTGQGSSMWVAYLYDLTEVAHNGGEIDWTIVPLTDGYNPYDLAGYGQYIYVTLQGGDGVLKLDSADNYAEVASVFGLDMPQGIAISGAVVCVAESDLGMGNQVSFMDLDLNSPYPITVGQNPQAIVTDQDGNFHVICTGNYSDITGEAWRIDPTMGEPGTSYVELGGTPSTLVAMQDGNGNEKIVCGDEYAANPPYLYAYDSASMIVDQTVPVYRSGGWSMATGNDGVFIGSAISHSIYYQAFDWSGYEFLFSFEAAVASLAYYEMPAAVVRNYHTLTPVAFQLGNAWPNPFNASATVNLTVSQPRNVVVALYDVLGRHVQTLHHGQLPAGNHRLHLGADRLASGTYIITARTDDFSESRTVTVVR